MALVALSLAAAAPGGAAAPGSAAPPSAAASTETFTWCGGRLTADLDRWLDSTGITSVFGWSYVTTNGHSAALRVDGTTIYSAPQVTPAQPLQLVDIQVDAANARGVIIQEAGSAARITTTVQGTSVGGCCQLRTDVEVENIDSVAHSFEWRWFHDTAYGFYFVCASPPPDPDVDGGEICLPGQVPGGCETVEFDGLARAAVGCGKPLAFHSADTGAAGPVYVMDDTVNKPIVTELLFWEAFAGQPGRVWSGMVNGQAFDGCEGDNALLVIWQLPAAGGPLAPGATAGLTYYIGQGCEPTCCAPPCCVPGTPGTVGNTLKLVRRDPLVEATWGPASNATTYTLRYSDFRDYRTPADDIAGIATTTVSKDVAGITTRYWRVRGVDCAGTPGPE